MSIKINCVKLFLLFLDKVYFTLSKLKTSNSEFLSEYNLAFNALYNRYGLTINDFLFFFDLIKNYPADVSLKKKYVEDRLNRNIKIRQVCTNEEPIKGFKDRRSIESIIVENGDYENIIQNAPKILKVRLLETIEDYNYKENFKTVARNFILSEEKRIDDELYKVISTPKETSETS